MTLQLNQLRALSVLRQRRLALDEAVAAYGAAELDCFQLGISDRQLAAIVGGSPQTIWRRRQRTAQTEALRD